MILQALNDYYRRKCDDADPTQRLSPFGLEQKEIPFVLELSADGELLQMRDTRELRGKKKVAQSYRVPQGVKKTSGVDANLLWDTVEYVLGVGVRGKPERVAEQHAAFRARIAALPESVREDAGIRAVTRFLACIDQAQLERWPAWVDALESNAVLSFRLQGDFDLVCQRPAVIKSVLNIPQDVDARVAMCLVTGEHGPIERLHTSIKGVWGAQTAGANIVSFNARAFESYGKTERQGENAPVSQAAAFAYTTALNHLLRKDSSQRIQVGDASTVFWSDRESEFESTIPNIFGEPPKDNPDQNVRAVHALLEAIASGKLGNLDAESEGVANFHVLGLAPNAARISIRFYHCLPLYELGERIVHYFKDLEIARGPNDPQYPSLFRLLAAVAVQNKADNIPPNLGGAIVDAVFSGTKVQYPSQWLNAAVGRCRAEQKVNYLRAAAIKACLNRQIRSASVNPASHMSPEKEFLPMLDLSNQNPAYRLGRLFAVLERIQEEAADGRKINSTIRDRYYGAASSTPVAVFTALLRLKNAHMKKLLAPRGTWFEKLIGEILEPVGDFPKHLPLPDQGRFALGYYHQRQDFFTKKPEAVNTTKEGTAP